MVRRFLKGQETKSGPRQFSIQLEKCSQQGSVLGPILFVVYLNDLPELVSNRMKLYADDSKIITAINDWIDSNHLQKDLDVVSKWMKD